MLRLALKNHASQPGCWQPADRRGGATTHPWYRETGSVVKGTWRPRSRCLVVLRMNRRFVAWQSGLKQYGSDGSRTAGGRRCSLSYPEGGFMF